MAKVVIYGFGVVGKNLFRFLLDSGIPYAIANDEIIEYYSDDVKMDYIQNIEIADDDIVAICTTHDCYRQAMLSKIKNAFGEIFDFGRVIDYTCATYAPKYARYIDRERIKSALLRPKDFSLILEDSIKCAVACYEASKKEKNTKYKDVVCRDRNSGNIFQAIHKVRLGDKPDMIKYPFFSVFFSEKAKDKEFGFREPIDWDLMQNSEFRAENKLVCVFGNSQVFGESLSNIEDTLPCLIKDELKHAVDKHSFYVLNCGQGGNSILEEIILFVTIIDRIKPDIVVSVNGVDLNIAFRCDKNLIEKHALFYKGYEERIYKDYCGSEYPLPGEMNMFRDLDKKKLYESYFYRLKQFEKIVKMNEAVFISCLQPTVYRKKSLTGLEAQKVKNNFDADGISDKEREMIAQIGNMMCEFYEYATIQSNKLENLLDLNLVIKDEDSDCFVNWVHMNGYGNGLIAKAIVSRIKLII